MRIQILALLLFLGLLMGCSKSSAEPAVEKLPDETAELSADEVQAAMHEIAPVPVRSGEEKDASEFVAPDGENIRLANDLSYQLVEGGAYLGGAWVTYYNFETEEKVIACAKDGCTHSDESCPAWIGGGSDYALYRGNFYALQRNDPDGEWSLRLQKRAQEGETWEILWEHPNQADGELIAQGMLGGNWAVLTLNAIQSDGTNTMEVLAVNLEDGTEKEVIPETAVGLNAPGENGSEKTLSISLWGAVDGFCVISRSILPADFPTLDAYLASAGPLTDDQAISAATDEYIAQIDAESTTEYACYDLASGQRSVISAGPTAEVSGVCDSTSLYQGDFYYFKDGAIRAFNLKTKAEKEILNAAYIGRITVVDGQVFYVLNVGNISELDSYSLVDGTVTKFTNEGNSSVVVFTVYQENGDMFAGNYNGTECWISKEDYYAENFAAAIPIP